MITRRVLTVSIAFNVLLAALLMRTIGNAGHPFSTTAARPRGQALREATLGVRADPDAGVAGIAPLDWSSLWQGGYRAAVAQLRALGFPEAAVQDLVVGRINRRYGPELLRLRADAWKFWQPEQRRGAQEAQQSRRREEEAGALEAERAQAVFDALNLDWSAFSEMLTGRPSSDSKYLSGLAPASAARAAQVVRKFDALERAVICGANGTIGVPERAELDTLYRAKLDELGTFLSPQELEEYELRAGPTANRMRQLDLIGFDPTEEEFRSIHRIRKAYDENTAKGTAALLSGDRSELWQNQATLEERLEQALGPERYQAYRRSMDYTFRGLVELTAEFDVAVEAAAEVHQLRETTLQELHAASSRAQAGPQERADALRKIRAGAEARTRDLLGEAAYGRYRQMQISGWLINPEDL